MSYGVTSGGFVKKRLRTILDTARSSFEGIVGGVIGFVFDGLITTTLSEAANLWDMGEGIAMGMDPNGAEGIMLDHGAAWTGAYREQATATRGPVQLSGPAGTAIALGTEVRASGLDVRFRITQDVVLGATSTIVDVVCTQTGAIVVEAGQVDEFVDAVVGVTVTNLEKLTTGTEREIDEVFRVTRRNKLSPAGESTPASLAQKLRAIDGIEQARIFDNKTGQTDVFGLPAGGVRAVLFPESVDPAVLDAIANVFVSFAGASPYLVGDVTRIVDDSDGYPQLFRWDWANVVDLYVDVIRVGTPGYPTSADDQIKARLSELSDGFVLGGVVRPHELECDVLILGYSFSSLQVRVSTTNPPDETDVVELIAQPNELYRIMVGNIRILDP